VQRSPREISACGRSGHNIQFPTIRNSQQNVRSVAFRWIGALRTHAVKTGRRCLLQ